MLYGFLRCSSLIFLSIKPFAVQARVRYDTKRKAPFARGMKLTIYLRLFTIRIYAKAGQLFEQKPARLA